MQITMLGLPNSETPVPIYDDHGNQVGEETRTEMPPVQLEIQQDAAGNVVAAGLTFPRHLTYDQAVLAALAQHIAEAHGDGVDSHPEVEAMDTVAEDVGAQSEPEDVETADDTGAEPEPEPEDVETEPETATDEAEAPPKPRGRSRRAAKPDTE